MDINLFAKSNIVVDNLTTKQKHIIHVIPEFKSNLITDIKNIGVKTNSIHSIISPLNRISLVGKIFNGKDYYNQLKIQLKQKDINILVEPDLPKELTEGRFTLIDHSVLSNAVTYISEISNQKQALKFLFSNLKESFLEIKRTHPDVTQTILFNVNKYEKGLINILSYLTYIQDQDLNTDFNSFDDIIILSVSQPENRVIDLFPFMFYDNKGKIDIYKSNLSKVNNRLKEIDKERLKLSIQQNLSKDKQQIEKTDTSGPVTSQELIPSEQIDQHSLSKILKNYKIKDMTISSNIKTAVDKYIKDNPAGINKDNLEQVILRSVHHSLYQTDDIREEFLHDPGLLFKKLVEVNTHSSELNIPETRTNQSINPKDIVTIKKINSIRTKYELDENIDESIRDLFYSLESKQSAPIKILNINKKYEDDNLNRFIRYTITVKNVNKGFKEPYDLTIKVPALVNDRYLKLNSSDYILLSQQYLVPITKDKVNEARFLTHFQMTRLVVKNLKFNVSQIEDILNYCETKYSNTISSIEKDEKSKIKRIEFKDGTIISPRDNIVFQDNDRQLIRANNSNKYVIKKISDPNYEINVEKNEFLFNELLKQINKVNPTDSLTTSRRSIPYIQANIVARRLPLVFFLIQQQGLIESLIKLGVDYEISKTPSKKDGKLINIKLNSGETLFIYPEDLKQEYIFNGLYQLPKTFLLNKNELNSRYILDEYLKEKYNTRTCERFDQAAEKMIDPTTSELLKFYEYPNNYIDVLTGPLLKKLLNDAPDHPSDLKNLRVRQAEVFSNIIYDQISIAHNNLVERVNTGSDDAKLRLDENYIINNLMGRHRDSRGEGGSLLEFVNPFSPIDELIKSAKVVRTGIGGIPSKQAFRKEQRAIHPSYVGNISSHSTGEYDS